MALLPTRQRDQILLMVIVLSLGAIGGYFMYMFGDKAQEIATLDTHVTALTHHERQGEGRHQGRRLRSCAEGSGSASRRDLARPRPLGAARRTKCPALLDQVSTAARRAGLELQDVAPAGPQPGEEFDTYKYKVGVARRLPRDRAVPHEHRDARPHRRADERRRSSSLRERVRRAPAPANRCSTHDSRFRPTSRTAECSRPPTATERQADDAGESMKQVKGIGAFHRCWSAPSSYKFDSALLNKLTIIAQVGTYSSQLLHLGSATDSTAVASRPTAPASRRVRSPRT